MFTVEERNDVQESEITSSLETVAAMLHVPPEQVPEGVLHLARAHRNQIEHVRILISYEEEVQSITSTRPTSNGTMHTCTATATTTTTLRGAMNKSTSFSIIETQQKSPLSAYRRSSSSEEGVLPSPSASAAQSAAAIFASDQQRRTTEINNAGIVLDDAHFRRQLLCDNDDDSRKERTYLLLFVLSSPQAARDFVQDLNKKPYTTLDEAQVAHVNYVVGLEGHNGVSLLSPVFCSTPADLAKEGASRGSVSSRGSKLSEETPEVHNCAVCLEPLEQAEETGIITTVCNHSFHWACLWQCKDSPCPVCRYDHAGLNEALSQCHVCGTTEHNYVCLICGVISCANMMASASLSLGHARQHHDETLHAYALDTETQHVWDFCGQGYVHRLLQNTSDGKLVEVSNQNYNQRLPEAGRLSDAQEDEVVHRKLEGFANQYYTLLKSQLEQQRIFYEGRLEELLRNKETQRRVSSSASLVSALKQERRQLQHRLSTLQERHHKVVDEVSFLKNLNESLETNKEQMKHQVQESQRERGEARDLIQQALPPLELKVHRLMLQLEQEDDTELKPASR